MKTFTTHDIAKMLNMSPATIYRWVNNGEMTYHLTIGKHIRVTEESLIVFVKKNGFPFPAELLEVKPCSKKKKS